MATVESLERQVERLPLRARGRFLLAYAQRLAEVFELFEVRARGTSGTFRELLCRLWADASRSPPGQTSPAEIAALIPGVDWIVDGFHDGIAQEIGAMAYAAASAFYLGTIEGRPYANPFTVLETLLTEMHLHCLTAPDYDEGIAFQANLHRDPLVKRETAIFEQLRALCLAEDPVDIERFARSNILSIAELEPELSQGLAADP